MDVFVVGQGKVSLGQKEFVGQGGEASVYARGDVAYKVYADPKQMLSSAKIQELAVLTHPSIIRPQAILLDGKNRPVGYTMRRVQNAHVLCQLFNRAFRERRGLTPEAMLRLVQKLQEGVRHVHEKGILIVDLNEMNFLLDSGIKEVLFIDVDSYQTPGFPATALMDSVRDRHASRFSEGTDWFSFGIVSFQMFVGIHPYKGKHPSALDLDARMRGNISIFDPQVSVPKVCYPFSVIPQAYQEWYRAVFEDGRRDAPPEGLRPVVLISPKVEQAPAGDHLRIWELRRFPAEIIHAIPYDGTYAAVTTDGLYVGDRKHELGADVRLGVTPRMAHLIAAWVEGRRLALYDVTAGQRLATEIEAEAITTSDGRIYVKAGGSLNEVEFVELPAGIRAAARPVGNAMEQATRLFDGVAIQSLLGACYASLFPKAGSCCSMRIQELDGYQIVDARSDNNVLMVVGVQNGRYDRFVLRPDESCQGYDLRVVRDIVYSGLNFVVLENGICVHLNENEELELFANQRGAQTLKVNTDPAVRGARLFKSGTQVLFARGETLYSATMK